MPLTRRRLLASYLGFLSLAKDPSAPRSKTAVLSERETNNEAQNRRSMLRIGGKVYTRHEDGEITHKHINDPDRHDMGARIAVERVTVGGSRRG